MPDYPLALAHGPLQPILPEIFIVSGAMAMKGPITFYFGRNMTVVRQDGELTLINTVRLNETGLAELEALGTIKHVICLAGFHGRDDAFYRDRYQATLWSVNGDDDNKGKRLAPGVALPLAGAEYLHIPGKANDGLIRLPGEGGIVIAGDSLQNWAEPDEYCTFLSRWAMRFMGFFKPHNVGPAWFKGAEPDKAAIRAIVDWQFEHLLPSHGTPVLGGAREKFRPAIERITKA